MTRPAFCLALLLVWPLPVLAQDWILALSWHPGFCAADRNATTRPECKSTSTTLVLHGLWPKRGQFCAHGGVAPRGNWRDLPAPAISPDTPKRLPILMPGSVSGLDRYQWAKHGSCAGIQAQHYFDTALALTQTARQGATARLLTAQSGQDIPLADLCQTLAQDLGPDFARSVKLVTQPHGLSEIRVYLRDHHTPQGIRLDLAADFLAPAPQALACQGRVRIAR